MLKDQIAELDRIWMIALMLIVFGMALLVADRLPERKELRRSGFETRLAMGVGQALALQPGVSRSGATLTVSRFLGYERDAAARLVFLMSLPIIAGAGVFALADASIPSDFWPPFLWGMAASAPRRCRRVGNAQARAIAYLRSLRRLPHRGGGRGLAASRHGLALISR